MLIMPEIMNRNERNTSWDFNHAMLYLPTAISKFPILQLHSAGFSNPVDNKRHNHNHLVTYSNQFNPAINSLNVKTWIHKLLRIQYLSSLLELISFQQTGCLENTRNAVNENMCVTASSENSWNCNWWILKNQICDGKPMVWQSLE